MVERTTITRVERKAIIVAAAIRAAKRYGLANITAERVAEECIIETSSRTVRSCYTMQSLRQIIAGKDDLDDVLIQQAREMGLRS